MRAETKELWLNLCERAANEQDPDRLLAIVGDINAASELKLGRLKQADTRLGRNAVALTLCHCAFCVTIPCHSAVARLMRTERLYTKNATSSECR